MAMKRETAGDRVFLVVNTVIVGVALVVVAYPLLFVLSASVSDPDAVYRGEVWLFPRGLTLEGYRRVLENPDIWTGYRNTVFYTVAGTLINLAVTIPCAYALSRRDLAGRNVIMFLFTFTMFFSGGIIPTYLIVDGLGLRNKVWAMILPNAAAVWYIIIGRTYMQKNIPESLQDAAFIDGSSNTWFLIRIVLPLSAPIVAVLSLFYGVQHWNAYFGALIYLSRRELYPLQLVLREILIISEMGSSTMMTVEDAQMMARMARVAELVKYAVMIVSSLPVMVAYPFIQRYFTKGVMIGAIKG
jgi:putative aldouronate transport system permease protein